jgi:hypothetical protein
MDRCLAPLRPLLEAVAAVVVEQEVEVAEEVVGQDIFRVRLARPLLRLLELLVEATD